MEGKIGNIKPIPNKGQKTAHNIRWKILRSLSIKQFNERSGKNLRHLWWGVCQFLAHVSPSGYPILSCLLEICMEKKLYPLIPCIIRNYESQDR